MPQPLLTRRVKKDGGRAAGPRPLLFFLLVSVAGFVLISRTFANPEEGTVTAGQAFITSSPGRVEINQSSPRAVIDWRSFDIAPDETTRFNQPGPSALTLNRVNSPDPSHIAGKLEANGNLILVNPSGIFFSSTAQVDVGGLIATSAGMATDDFMRGSLHFNRPGAHDAQIRNDGRMTAREAGLIGLVAPRVENNGYLEARLGRVSLAAGDTATVDFQGDSLIQVAIDEEMYRQLATSQNGTLSAEGGTVQVTAAASRQMLDALVSVEGRLTTSNARGEGGRIIIGGDGTQTRVGGSVEAKGQRGGKIDIAGRDIRLTSPARINAQGEDGGGTVQVGGGYQGASQGGPSDFAFAHARTTVVEPGAGIKVDAVHAGEGGRAIFWSDHLTQFGGHVTARGGDTGGSGGLVEVSSEKSLLFRGQVDTQAPWGRTGLLLLDPADIVIASGSGDGAADGSGTFAGSPSGATGTVTGADAGPSTFYESELEGIAATTNISLMSTNSIVIADLADGVLNFGQTAGRSVTLSTGAGGLTMLDLTDTLATAGGALNVTTTGGGVALLGNLSTSGGLITANVTGASTVSGNITGTGTSLTKSGTGTLTLLGTNTYSGNTTVSAGALQMGSAANMGSGTLVLNGGTLQGSGTPVTLANPVSLAASSTLAGTSPLTFTGVLTNTVTASPTLTNNSTGPVTFSNTVNLSNSATSRTINFAGTGQTILTGFVVNGGTAVASALVKSGTGTLILQGNNTHAGGTTLSAGTLIADGTAVFGTGTLTLGGGVLQAATTARTFANPVSATASTTVSGLQDLTFSGLLTGANNLTLTNNATGTLTLGNINLSNSATNRTLTFSGTGTTVVNGVVANGGGSSASALSKTGTGSLILNGANTYGGNTTLGAGVLRATQAMALGAGNLLLSGGTLQLAADSPTNFGRNTTLSGAATVTVDRLTPGAAVTHTLGTLSQPGVALSLGAGGNISSGTTGLTFGAVNLTGNATYTTGASTLLSLGAFSNGGISRTLTKAGAGTLYLSAPAASWATIANVLVVNNGSVRLGAHNALGTANNTNVTVNATVAGATALLDLDGFNQSIRSLTFGGAGGTTTSTNAVATGAGTLTLGGNVTALNTGNPLASTLSGHLDLGGATRTFNIGDSTSAGIDLILSADISGVGAGLTKATSAGHMLLSGNNTYSGTTTLSVGTLWVASPSAFGSGPLSIGGATLRFYSDTPLALSTPVTVTGSSTFTSDRQSNGPGLMHSLGSLSLNSTTVTVGAGSSVTSGTAGVTFGPAVLTGSPTFSVGSGAQLNVGALTDGGVARTLTKSGAGTLALTAPATSWATASDALTINNGKVQLASSHALGTANTTNVAVNATVAGATALFDLNGFDQSIGTLVFGGTGATTTSSNVVTTGLGTLTIGGTLTSSATGNPLGGTLSGFLDLGSASRTFNIGDSTSATDDLVIDAVISGAGVGLTKATGTGKLVLKGANTYTGTTTLSAGTLRATHASALGTGNLVLSGGLLQLAADSDTVFGRNTTVSASSTIIVDRLTPGAAVNHTLGTLSQAAVSLSLALGSLITGGTGSLTFGATNFTGSPTFGIQSGTRLNVGALTDGGVARTLTKSGAGILAMTAPAASWALAHALTINNGTVLLSAGGALGAGTTTGVTVNANVAGATALLDLNGFNQGISNLTFGGTGGTSTSTSNVATGAGTLTLGGNVTYTNTGNPQGATLSGKLNVGSVTRTLTINDSASAATDLTVNAVVSGTGGLIKAGAGRLLLGGANTYSGTTTLSAGVIGVGDNAAAGTGTLVLNGGAIEADGAARSMANPVSLAASSTISGAQPLTFNGLMTNTLAGNPTLTVNNTALTGVGNINLSTSATSRTLTVAGSGPLAVTGVIANGSTSTAGGLTLNGSGTVTLSGLNTYGGATTVTGGTLRLGAAETLPNTTAVSVGASGVLDLNSMTETIMSLNSSGGVMFGSGNTFTTSGAQMYGGPVTGGSVTLISTAGGALLANNPLNDFTGVVSANTLGTISLQDANALALGAVSGYRVTAQAGGDLSLSGQVSGSDTAGDPVVLVTGGAFSNGVGATALQTGAGGRWLVYSGNPAADTPNGLPAGFRRFSCTFGGSCPPLEVGNGFLYAYTPTLTLTPVALAALTYGDPLPSLTHYAYTTTGYLGSDAGADTLTGTLDGATTYTQGASAGSYPVTYSAGTVTSAMGYAVLYNSNATGLTVNKRLVSAVVQPHNLTYGTPTPTLHKDHVADVVWGNLYGADDSTALSGAVFTYGAATPGLGNPVGSYVLGVSGVTSANYTLGAVTTGLLSVQPYSLGVRADTLSKVVGRADPPLTYTYDALVNGDTAAVFSGALVRAPGETVSGSPYAITQGTLHAGPNYTLLFTPGQLTLLEDTSPPPPVGHPLLPLTVQHSLQTVSAVTTLPGFSVADNGQTLVGGLVPDQRDVATPSSCRHRKEQNNPLSSIACPQAP